MITTKFLAPNLAQKGQSLRPLVTLRREASVGERAALPAHVGAMHCSAHAGGSGGVGGLLPRGESARWAASEAMRACRTIRNRSLPSVVVPSLTAPLNVTVEEKVEEPSRKSKNNLTKSKKNTP